MPETLSNALIEAINDEYKARATYLHVIGKFGETRPFIHIVEAEGRHIEALLTLFNKYEISVPEDNWHARTATGVRSCINLFLTPCSRHGATLKA